MNHDNKFYPGREMVDTKHKKTNLNKIDKILAMTVY